MWEIYRYETGIWPKLDCKTVVLVSGIWKWYLTNLIVQSHRAHLIASLRVQLQRGSPVACGATATDGPGPRPATSPAAGASSRAGGELQATLRAHRISNASITAAPSRCEAFIWCNKMPSSSHAWGRPQALQCALCGLHEPQSPAATCGIACA